MKNHLHLSTLTLALLALPAHSLAQSPPSTQSSLPTDPNAKRLTFLGDQLSADEATITAINHALVVAGYKASLASDRIANAAKGNELMDRQGGAPVPWQDFYGRSAKSFITRAPYSDTLYKVGRPSQFNYVYRANDSQADAARAEVEALGNRTDALLARRHQLELEQASLWATIAFESITNREIPLHPLYRDQLQVGTLNADKHLPDPARLAALRAAVLYVKTIDHTVAQLVDRLPTDQPYVYATLRATLDKAHDSLREAAAEFSDTPGIPPAETKQFSDLASQAKRIKSLCQDIAESSQKAAEADTIHEDQRKLLYRATLQDSLFNFAEAIAQLDDSLASASTAWDIHPIPGQKNPDQPPDLTTSSPTPVAAPAPSPIAPTVTTPTPSPAPNAPSSDSRIAFTGQKDTVTSICFLPDGKRVVSGGANGSVYLWDLATGNVLATFSGHTSAVNVAVTHNGSAIVSDSMDHTVCTWDITSGRLLQQIKHGRVLTKIALSPDDRFALIGGFHGLNCIDELSTGKSIPNWPPHEVGGYAVAWSRDGRFLATGGSENAIFLWNAANLKEIRQFTGGNVKSYSIAFTPDARFLLAAQLADPIRLWDVATGQFVRQFKGHQGVVGGVAISPNGKTFVSYANENDILQWDLATGQLLHRFSGHTRNVSSLAFAPDGHSFVSGSDDGTIRLWNLDAPAAPQSSLTPPTTPNAPAPTTNAPITRRVDLLKLVDPAKDQIAGSWNLQNGLLLGSPSTDPNSITRFEFPYEPPQEYDYRVVFTRLSGNTDISLICFAAGRQFSFCLGAFGNTTCGFGLVDGQWPNKNRTAGHSKAFLTNGKQYTLVVKIRTDGTQAFLDDTLISTLKTLYDDVSLGTAVTLPHPNSLGLHLGAPDVSASIQSAEILEITGQGKPLR